MTPGCSLRPADRPYLMAPTVKPAMNRSTKKSYTIAIRTLAIP